MKIADRFCNENSLDHYKVLTKKSDRKHPAFYFISKLTNKGGLIKSYSSRQSRQEKYIIVNLSPDLHLFTKMGLASSRGGVVEFAAAGAIDVDHSDSICARVKMLTLMEEPGPVKSAGCEVKPTLPISSPRK